ncbi:branched-chain-amino-acid transaminase [Verrucomicrobiaceae bacterium R5-34]|uniref:Branched-chain-amino-acid aminotransferase n=1 Tax=Oceaniferula flava TaxID=2800421 RepID=A0AAE2S9I1_9BACT|nr:branched-chain-amino-acid transaminase [Oceaniferula flavus]MBK1829497.1 branched-chain-amino-acid transaminase [Verrucomicrobiaceae bacterium R5-34]MBK1853726.1 branched-chain-amino-acid transaminase [Oceaniferula flavus]MBM1135032.1 branched-chain-amino-acid transaminase [Oceaniferula flavus]
MSDSQKIWLDGELVDEADAKISIFDHGLLYGDGIFEGIRAYNGRVFRLKEHVERLFLSAKAILLDMPWTESEVCDIVCETVRANGLSDGYIRLVVTRGSGGLGLNPYLCPKPSMFCIAASIQLYPKEHYENGLELITCSTRRPTHATLSPQVKSLNYLNNVMAKVECIQAGVMEGLMLNEHGTVAECTGDTVFIVKDGVVYTPPISDGALDGITRAVIFELCERLDIKIVEKTMTRYDVYTSDECFLTGTAAEVIPVVKMDSRAIGDGTPGEVFKKLLDGFRHETTTTGVDIA